jgi:hypothetical protein
MARLKWHESMVSTKEMAYVMGVCQRRVQQLTADAIRLQLAARVGGSVVFHRDAYKWLATRITGGHMAEYKKRVDNLKK